MCGGNANQGYGNGGYPGGFNQGIMTPGYGGAGVLPVGYGAPLGYGTTIGGPTLVGGGLPGAYGGGYGLRNSGLIQTGYPGQVGQGYYGGGRGRVF
jgi:hypothetical protein